MVSIRVIARGFQNNRNLLHDLIDNHDERIGEILHKVAEDVVAEARHNIQQNVSINTGSLLASIKILDEDLPKSVEVGSDLFYAAWVEYGRGPITPKTKEYLHFFTKDGKEVFTKYAGPAEPQPFLEPAVTAKTKMFKDLYIQENEDIINKKANTLLDSEILD